MNYIQKHFVILSNQNFTMRAILICFTLILTLSGLSSCKKTCMYCTCNYGTMEYYEESDCDSGFDNEEKKLADYDAKLRTEKGYSYCDCYGVNQ